MLLCLFAAHWGCLDDFDISERGVFLRELNENANELCIHAAKPHVMLQELGDHFKRSE